MSNCRFAVLWFWFVYVCFLLCGALCDEVLQCCSSQPFSSVSRHLHTLLWCLSIPLHGELTHLIRVLVSPYLFLFQFSFFYVVALILIIAGVFIYNIVQPKVARKDNSRTGRILKPLVKKTKPSEDLESPPGEDSRKGLFVLRELLESSTFETTSDAVPPVRKKRKSRQRNSSSRSYPSPTAKSPLATPTSLTTYGSLSLSNSVESDSAEVERFRGLTQRPIQAVSKSGPTSAIHQSTN